MADAGGSGLPEVRLQRTRVADQIIEDLRDQIARGILANGTRMPTEKELAARYGVSPPTIREALRALTSMGLVTLRRGSRGYVNATGDALLASSFVTLMQLESVRIIDVVRLLDVLHAHCVELAAEHATEADIATLREAVAEIRDAADTDAMFTGVERLLLALARSSHDPLLIAICSFFSTLLIELERDSSPPSREALRRWSASLDDLRDELVDALAARDRQRAVELCHEYHRRGRERMETRREIRDARLSEAHFAGVMSSLLNRTGAESERPG